MRPVAQKAHASAQPTCELTQTVKRPGCSSGIRTLSSAAPSGAVNRYLINASTWLARSEVSASVGT